MKTRMQPIGMVWNKLPRVVRDLAVSLGKQILLDMDGAEKSLRLAVGYSGAAINPGTPSR